jgi:phenol hydroxylase P1 protein
MSNIDLRTVSIKPLRQTFDHIARRFGDKPASRYQEGTYDLQATHNFHYRPTWDPTHEIFDATRTKIVMKDWYAFKDPRQFYYGTYTMARARQQETAEANFDFVEARGLADVLPEDVKQTALDVLVPLRHVEWGGNMNNAFICAYGYGTAITQPCIFQSMDQLGIAQYLTRIGLLLADPEALDDRQAGVARRPDVAAAAPLRRGHLRAAGLVRTLRGAEPRARRPAVSRWCTTPSIDDDLSSQQAARQSRC